MSHRSISDVTDDGKDRVRTVYGDIENGYKFEGNNRTKTQEERAIAEDIDAELLRRLMVKLGIAEKQSHSIIANPVQEKRATLNKGADDGITTLALNDPFDRAWRRVGLALDRIGFLVEDRNRSQGLFYVRYSDIDADMPEENKKGLLDKLKFWGDDDKKEQPKPEPEPKKQDKGMVDKLKFWENNKDKAAAELQYRIKLERAGEGTEVTVVDKDGKRDHTSTANRILSMLYDQLK
jgi:outer membrane protein assembly factor BamC